MGDLHEAYASSTYTLTAAVMYHSEHYLCLAHSAGQWMVLDDDRAAVVMPGDWTSVKEEWLRRGYEPTLLVYERADDQCSKHSS